MAENGSLRERWQYRQEMKAHGAWNHWGFPTREDYAQFSDARNLADLLKTWRPHNLEAYGLGEQGLTPLTHAEKEAAYALLDKRIESGLSEAEVRTYAQLVNRWQAEHRMLAGEEVQGPSAERAQIEADTERLKQEVQSMGDVARARAYYIGVDGLTLGDKGNRLYTGGQADWVAPKIHPVWAPEVAREADIVEQMGSATFEYEPLRQKLREWAAAGKPDVRIDDDHYVPYEQTRTALHEALGEVLELQQQHHLQSAEYLDLQAEAAELRQALHALDRTPAALHPQDQANAEIAVTQDRADDDKRVTHALGQYADQARAWVREPDGVTIRDLRDRLDALQQASETPAVQQRPEEIAERIADLLEEAQRQGLVVTGQETPPETQALQQQKRMGY